MTSPIIPCGLWFILTASTLRLYTIVYCLNSMLSSYGFAGIKAKTGLFDHILFCLFYKKESSIIFTVMKMGLHFLNIRQEIFFIMNLVFLMHFTLQNTVRTHCRSPLSSKSVQEIQVKDNPGKHTNLILLGHCICKLMNQP